MAGLDPATQLRLHFAMVAYVYIMSNKRYGTIYVGVTSDLARRVWEHREGTVPGFTSRYRLQMLVYHEAHDTITGAIQREHNMKHWPRRWKTALVDGLNPEWDDLSATSCWLRVAQFT